jgi:hypothetical protein
MPDPRQPSWGEVFDTILSARLRSVHTAMVGEIRSYSEADQTAEVTLAVQLETTDGEFAALPPLADVPVLWPGAWAAGDTCLLVFSEESFSKWWDTGSVEQPEVLRRHGLHAVCIPVVARAGQAVQFVALANLVTAALDKLQSALDDTFTVLDGLAPGTSAAFAAALAVPPAFDSNVAAEKVKAR